MNAAAPIVADLRIAAAAAEAAPKLKTEGQLKLPTAQEMAAGYARYFGTAPGGHNLIGIIQNLETSKMQTLADDLKRCNAAGGRVFVIGNGGSWDNALALAKSFREAGIRTEAAGDSDAYFTGDYSQIFVRGMKEKNFGANDMVVGLSGSGNSPNVVKAFEYAKEAGGTVFALGGRDGGKMRVVAGDERSLIAKTQSMEALEDAHLAVGQLVARHIRSNEALDGLRDTFASGLRDAASVQTCQTLGLFARQLVQVIRDEGRLFVIGDVIGMRHFQSDAGRGFTNSVPIAGINAPALYSVNSAMATLNDDGLPHLMSHGLKRMNPGPKDVAIMFISDDRSLRSQVAEANEVLRECNVPRVAVCRQHGGDGRIDMSPIERLGFDPTFVTSAVGHATGDTIRQWLWAKDQFNVRPLEMPAEIKINRGPDEIRPNKAEMVRVESELKQAGVLAEDEVLTMAYGKPYASRNPAVFGMRRV